jgi:hypothetical protein
MALQGITARPHPEGNRIDLEWKNPDPAFPGVRVVRRAGTHPAHPDDGVVVAEGLGLERASDRGLPGERYHYYALFPFQGDPPVYRFDSADRASALATSPQGLAEQMYGLLPRIYHRYDIALPDPTAVAPADRGKGQLRRFLDIPGGRLDMLLSQANTFLDLHNLESVDGKLLHLLAQWIGWKTDNKLSLAGQRQEMRNAPSLYRTIGIVPTLEATVKRIAAWESRTKEFVHNLFASGAPMRLNLWQARENGGGWETGNAPVSMDSLYEGRASAADAGGDTWLFYHTSRNGKWNIWYKRLAGGNWSDSRPLTVREGVDQHPSAVLQGGDLWVFWDHHDGTRWRLDFRVLAGGADGGAWSAAAPFRGDGVQRRRPCALADHLDRLWLFWLERAPDGDWKMRYNIRQGGAWLASDLDFPDVGGIDPRVEAEPFAFFHPINHEIWFFWSRREQGVPAAGQSRWRVAWRVKHNLDPDATGWDAAVSALPAGADPDHHDREPAACLAAGNGVRLFWSSNRDNGWAVWEKDLSLPAAPARVTAGPYAGRNALPLALPGGTVLLYRSNAPVEYSSEVYRATRTFDFRYSGSLTPDARDRAKLGLRGDFLDFNTYTYDAGRDGRRGNDDWYGRDTLGLYLRTDSLDPAGNRDRRDRLASVLGEFLPATDRAVFIEESAVAVEPVYAYEAEAAGEGGFIVETWSDQAVLGAVEEPLGEGMDFGEEWA